MNCSPAVLSGQSLSDLTGGFVESLKIRNEHHNVL